MAERLSADLGLTTPGGMTLTETANTGLDLAPKLSLDSPISSLMGVSGPLGSIKLSNMGRSATIDLSGAQTFEDLKNIIEGANLLMLEGRRVAHPGQQLSEAGGEGDFTPEQSQAAVDADRATFLAYSEAMRDVAVLLLAAIEKRDIDAMLENGGVLDETCEQCHRKFWYPNSPLPPEA